MTNSQPTEKQDRILASLIDEMFECNEGHMAHTMLSQIRQGINRSDATSMIQTADHLLRTGSHAWA